MPIRRTKLRAYLVASGILIGLLNLNTIASLPFLIGVVFMAFAAWVHVWSKGHLDKNASLTRSGPYRWVRDPFHLSNFFMDLGLCLVINNGVFTLVFMTFWLVAYGYRLGEEDKQLEEIFGDEYRDYRALIPRVIPYRKPMDKKYDKPFSVMHAPLYRGSVCTRLFRIASYPYLFFAAAQVGEHRLAVFNMDQNPLFYWALCGFVFFHFLSKAAGKITKKRQSLLPLWMFAPACHLGFSAALVALLTLVERLPLDTRIFELHLSNLDLLAALGLLALVLAMICPPVLWGSVRFRRLVEGVTLSVLCLFSPLPWLALLPACYFAAAFLYGDSRAPEANVGRVFPAVTGTPLLPVSRYMGLLVLFFVAKIPVLVG